MTDSFKEFLIEQTQPATNKILAILCVVSAVGALGAMLVFHWAFIILAIALGFLSYFIYFRKMTVEYEYNYMDKELSVDVIYNQNSRKSVENIVLDKMEVLALASGDVIKDYNNRNLAVTDYSTREPDNDEVKTYAIIYEGGRKILVSFNEEILGEIYRVMPSKVKKQ